MIRKVAAGPVALGLVYALLLGAMALGLRAVTPGGGPTPVLAAPDLGAEPFRGFRPLEASFLARTVGFPALADAITARAGGVLRDTRGRAPAPVAAPTVSHPLDNDDFADARPIELGSVYATDTRGATREVGEPRDCGSNIGGTVWYRFSAPIPVRLSADTIDSSYDTVLSVWTGSALATLEQVECSEDLGMSTASAVQIETAPNTVYYLRVGASRSSGGGELRFAVRQVVPPANDDFADAMIVDRDEYTHVTDVTGYTWEDNEPYPRCSLEENFAPGAAPRERLASAWYRVTAPRKMRITMDNIGSAVEFTNIAPFEGGELADLEPRGCTTGSGGEAFSVVIDKGATWHFQVSFAEGSAGRLVMNFDATPMDHPPPNDNFSKAIDVSDSIHTGAATRAWYGEDLEFASMQTAEPRPSCGGGSISNTVWYRFELSVGRTVTISTGGEGPQTGDAMNAPTHFDTVLGVYTGSRLNALRPVTCSHVEGPDDQTGRDSRVVVEAQAGRTYYVQAGGYAGETGDLTLRFR